MEIPVNGGTLYVEQHGQGADLVLMHGMGLTSAHTWDLVLPALAERFRVTVYDLRGQTRSRDELGDQSMARHKADLVELLDGLGLAQAHVVGFSLTGFPAQLVALEHPERVHSLTLVGTSAKVPEAFHRKFDERLAIIERDGFSAYSRQQLPIVMSERFMAERPDLVEWYRQHYEQNNPRAYARAMRAMLEMDLRDRIQALRCPVLIISGGEDRGLIRGVARLEAANELHRLILGSELVVLEESGHYVQFERPQEFVAALTDFLQRVERRQAR